jgi:hypothetical protein
LHIGPRVIDPGHQGGAEPCSLARIRAGAAGAGIRDSSTAREGLIGPAQNILKLSATGEEDGLEKPPTECRGRPGIIAHRI